MTTKGKKAPKDVKAKVFEKQKGKSALSGHKLDTNLMLADKHRLIPKSEGGGYVKGNTLVITPEEHMELHGNKRVRTPREELLKSMIDDRNQIMQLRNRVDNQVRAYDRRTDFLNPDTLEWLNEQRKPYNVRLKQSTTKIEKFMKEERKMNPLIDSALNLHGVGAMTVAYLQVYVNLEIADQVSKVWAYVGYDKPSHKRYVKGQKGGGNKTLRTQLFATADSFIKSRNVYREVYDNTKQRLSCSKNLVKSYVYDSSARKSILKDIMWQDTVPNHRHMASIRKMMKHFLADYTYVGRHLMGLPLRSLWVEERGHTVVKPEERGWIY